jgi:glyoxylase-like metal-dependent hydrolase (beta-lactamase superfamily II)
MTEIVPGIHRIESVLGPRPFSQYLLLGERSMLVDTGIISTPDDVILPYLDTIGFELARLDFVLVTHVDVDHFGGNARIREVAPRALICAHELDADLISCREKTLNQRYGWYAAHGPAVDYDADTKAFLESGMGPDVPVDFRLRDGECFRIGLELSVQVLHLPGHSPGHIGLWEPASRTAIVTDAVLGGGLRNFEGEIIHPPPYQDGRGYEATVRQLQALRPARLLTAHYEIMEGAEVDAFLLESLEFVDRARAATEREVAAQGDVAIASLLAVLGPELGPFSSFPNELAGPILAHLNELAESGRATIIEGSAPPAWRWTG